MNLNNFTIKSQEAIRKAQQLAFNNQNPNIETEHLLKALLTLEDSPVEYLLKKNNVNVNFVGRNWMRALKNFQNSSGRTGPNHQPRHEQCYVARHGLP